MVLPYATNDIIYFCLQLSEIVKQNVGILIFNCFLIPNRHRF